jgi:hypothetical protein
MIQTGSKQTASPEWRTFTSNPAGYADVARLAQCFDGAIGEAACQRMLQSQRLHERLSELLLDHYGLSGVVSNEPAALQAALGADLCTFAVANRDLAGPMQPLEPLEDIHGRVYADGLSCLGAWCQAMPGDTSMRVRLKLMPHELVDQTAAPFVETGPAIVRRAMS